MNTFEITAPDGKKYRIKGETQDGALQALQTHLGQGFRDAPQQQEQSTVGGLAREFTQGAMASFGDEFVSGARAALGARPNDEGGLDWLDYSGGLAGRYDENLEFTRRNMGEFSEENPKAALAARVGGAVTGAVIAAPKVARGAALLGFKPAVSAGSRVRRMAAGGAAAGAVEGYGAGEGGAESRLKSAGIGAGAGLVFAPLVGLGVAKIANQAEKLGGKVLRSVFANRRMFNPNSGRLTDNGRKRLADLGYDDIEALSAEMQRGLGVAMEAATDAGADLNTGATVGRLAAAERFGVPLTKGQATGDVIQSAAEENMRAGTRGQGAFDTVQGFDNMQGRAVESARDAMIDGGSAATPNRIDAAEAVMSGVQREAETARQAGARAYDTLEASGAALSGDAFPVLRSNIETAVQSSGIAIDAGTPNARAALGVLENAFQGAKSGAVPFKNIERARQQILAFQRAAKKGSNGPDQTAISGVIDEFDSWLDDTITDALISGDGAVLVQAKEARSLWAKYRSTFLGRDGADNFIRKIVEDDLAPDEVAGWMFGASANIGGGKSSLVARRVKDILGESSPEWQAIKRAGWDRITQNTEGRDAWGAQRVASNISELLAGKGQTLGRELYTPQELRAMSEFRDMLRVLVPPARSTNPSGSSYDMQRAVGDMARNMGVMLSASTGGADAAIGAAVANQAIKQGGNFSSNLQARAATRGITFKPASTPVAIGAGVGAGSAVQEQTIR